MKKTKNSLLKKVLALGLFVGGMNWGGQAYAGDLITINYDLTATPSTYNPYNVPATGVCPSKNVIVDLGTNVDGITTVSGGVNTDENVYGIYQSTGTLKSTSIADGIHLQNNGVGNVYGVHTLYGMTTNLAGMGTIQVQGHGESTGIFIGPAVTYLNDISIAFADNADIGVNVTAGGAEQSSANGIAISYNRGTVSFSNVGNINVTNDTELSSVGINSMYIDEDASTTVNFASGKIINVANTNLTGGPVYGISAGYGGGSEDGKGTFTVTNLGGIQAVSAGGDAYGIANSGGDNRVTFKGGSVSSLVTKSYGTGAYGIYVNGGTLTVEGLGGIEVIGSRDSAKILGNIGVLNLNNTMVEATDGVKTLAMSGGTLNLQGTSKVSGIMSFESNSTVNVAADAELHASSIANNSYATFDNSGKIYLENTNNLNTSITNSGKAYLQNIKHYSSEVTNNAGGEIYFKNIDIMDNTVTNSGGTIYYEKVTGMAGGTLVNNGGTVSIEGKGLSFSNLKGSEAAETYLFTLPSDIVKDETVITVNNFGFALNAGDSITIGGTLNTALKAGEKIVLIDSSDTLSLTDVNLNCSIAGLEIGLNYVGDNLILFAPEYLVDVKPVGLTDNTVVVNAPGQAIVNGSAVAASEDLWVNVYGGYTAGNDDVSGNKVTVVNESNIKGKIYGGYSYSGNAYGNKVEINGGSYGSGNGIYGGYSDSGNAYGNNVEINGGSYGSDNGIYGGYSGSGNAYGNKVEINGGSYDSSKIAGGYGDAGTDAVTKGNEITINDGNFSGTNIYAGVSDNGNANFNTLKINGGTFEDGTKIYGGMVNATGKVATNNTILLVGKFYSDSYSYTYLYGGYNSTDTTVYKTNNTLVVANNTERGSYCLQEVGGFDTYSFDLAGVGIWENTRLVSLSNTLTLDNDKIIISNFDASILEGGSSVTLIYNVEGTFAAESSDAYTIELTDNSLVLTAKNIAGAVTSVRPSSIADNIVTVTSLNSATVEHEGETKSVEYNNGSSTDGPWKNVYGGYSEESGAEVSNNILSVSAEVDRVYGNVTGGYSEYGIAANNEVRIAGDLTTRFIEGGYGSGGAYNNKVSITAGTINGVVNGGDAYAYDSSAVSVNNNRVTIAAGVFNNNVMGGYVYSYYSDGVSAINNTVTVTEGTFNGAVGGGYMDVGYSYYGSAFNDSNKVTIEAGTFNGVVAGGYMDADSAYYGSLSNDSNKVTIEAGTFNGVVAGGYFDIDSSDYGLSSNDSNMVTIEAGIFNGAVAGGYFNIGSGYSYYATENNNTVIINAGMFDGVVAGGYYNIGGGYSYYATENNNTVIINAGVFDGVVAGGYYNVENGSSSSETVSNNTVTINAGIFNDIAAGAYYDGGSYSSYATVDNNSVTIKAGTVSRAAGGYLENVGYSNASGNEVNIQGGTISELLVGGYVDGDAYGDAYNGSYNNTVKVQGGTVSGIIYGGYSSGYAGYYPVGNVDGGNAVVISDGVAGNIEQVFGGYGAENHANYNSVSIAADNIVVGTTGDDFVLVGGYSGASRAVGNQVRVSGGTYNGNIAGGATGSNAYAYGNKVIIEGGYISGSIYGSYAAAGSVYGDYYGNPVSEVIITAGAGGDLQMIVGGYAGEQGSCSEYNHVTVDAANMGIIAGGEEGFSAVGGYAKGSAKYNTLTIGTGTYDKVVAGAFVAERVDNAENEGYSNNVVINGGSFNDGIYGAYAPLASSKNNWVVVNANISLEKEIMGGYAGQDANYNRVEITALSMGTVKGGDVCAVVGGYGIQGDAYDNVVDIASGTYAKTVAGGYAKAVNARVLGNEVNIAGGDYQGIVYGGYAENGIAGYNIRIVNINNKETIEEVNSGNRVNVTGGSGTMKAVYGAYAGVGAYNNKVVMGAGYAGTVNGTEGVALMGGYAGLSSNSSVASRNEVVINGGTYGGAVYGGLVGDGTAGIAKDNKVTLGGGDLTAADIYGGHAATSAGNALVVGKSSITVKSINDFQEYYFDLSSSQKGDTLLTITNGTVDIVSNDFIKVCPGALAKDETVVLIDANASLNYDLPSSYSMDKVQIDAGRNQYSGTIKVDEKDGSKLVFTMGTAITYVEVLPGARTGNEVVLSADNTATVNGVDVSYDDNGGNTNGPWLNVYGGYSDTSGAEVSENTVTVTASGTAVYMAGISDVGGVYGGYSAGGAANKNEVLVKDNGETAVSVERIYGGYSCEGAAGNTVTIGTAGTAETAASAANMDGIKGIYGGCVDNEYSFSDIINNKVLFVNGTVTGNATNGINIYGGYNSTGNDVIGNSVEFKKGTDTVISLSNAKYIYGAKVDSSGTVKQNKVLIEDGSIIGIESWGVCICGAQNDGYGFGQYDEENVVEVKGGTLSNVDFIGGADSSDNNSRKNKISISGGTIIGVNDGAELYGAFSKYSASMTENEVKIEGTDTSLDKIKLIAGSYALDYTDKMLLTGNKVLVAGGTITGIGAGLSLYGALQEDYAYYASSPYDNNSVVIASDAQGNTAILNNVDNIAGVKGDGLYESSAKGNQVLISGGSIAGITAGMDIWGAEFAYYTTYSNINENSVVIKKDDSGTIPILENVCFIGGAYLYCYGSAKGNMVRISAGEITGIGKGMTLSGTYLQTYADYSQSLFQENIVAITFDKNGTVPVLGKVAGMYGVLTSCGTAMNNKVLINGGTITGIADGMEIAAAYDSYGYSAGYAHTGNSVEITAGSNDIVPILEKVEYIIGAHTEGLSLKNNRVLITAGSITGIDTGMYIMGAYEDNSGYYTFREYDANVVEIKKDDKGSTATLSNVTIIAGAHLEYGDEGKAMNNKVLISAGLIGGMASSGMSIFGIREAEVYGYGYGVSYENNRIEISGGELSNVNLIGAADFIESCYAADYSRNNTVLISAGEVTGLSTGMSIYGSFAGEDNTYSHGAYQENNVVEIKGSAEDTVLSNVATIAGAGYISVPSYEGTLHKNAVLISAGSITGVDDTGMSLYGAWGGKGDYSYYGAEYNGNSVEITGGTLDKVNVIAGSYYYSYYDSTLTGNRVKISAGSVTGFDAGMSIYGAGGNDDYDGSYFESNVVEISGVAVLNKVAKIAGAYSDYYSYAKNNKVVITGGTITGISDGMSIYGAEMYYSYGGEYDGNAVEITGGTITQVNSIRGSYAEKAYSTYTQSSLNNTVSITGGTVAGIADGMDICGAVNYVKEANNNKVEITGGNVTNVKDVYGGYGATGATGNSVTIATGSYSGNICGGYAESGDAKDNTVTITGGTFDETVKLYGGSAPGGESSGNTLNLTVKGLDIATAADFQYYNLDMTGVAAGETFLSLENALDLSQVADGGIVLTNFDKSVYESGDTITLVSNVTNFKGTAVPESKGYTIYTDENNALVLTIGNIVTINIDGTRNPTDYSDTAYVGADGKKDLGSDIDRIRTVVNGVANDVYGIKVEGDKTITVTSLEDGILVKSTSGKAYGISLESTGTNSITGLGDIAATSTGTGNAYGIYTNAGTNTVMFTTGGTITAKSSGGNADAIYLASNVGTNNISGLGSITAETTGSNGVAYGIVDCGTSVNKVDFASDGSIEAKAVYQAYGINAEGNSLEVKGLKTLKVTSTSNQVFGIYSCNNGTATVTFAGKGSSIDTESSSSHVYGIYNVKGTLNVSGMEKIDATGSSNIYGVYSWAGQNTTNTTVTFTGTDSSVEVKSDSGKAYGIDAEGGSLNVTGLGSIKAETKNADKNAYGIYAKAGTNTISIKGKGGQAITANVSTSGGTGLPFSIYAEETGSTTVNFEDSILSGKIQQDGDATLNLNLNDKAVWTPKTGDVGGTVTVNVNAGGKVQFAETATVATTLNNNTGTIEVSAKDVSVTGIIGSDGVDNYIFNIPTGIATDGSETMLNITGDTALTFTAGDILGVNNVTTLAEGDTITLITEATGTFNITGLSFYVDGEELTEGIEEYFKVSDDQKSIIFKNAILDVDIKPEAKDGGNTVEVTGDKTAKVNGEDPARKPAEGRNWKNVYGGYSKDGDSINNTVIWEDGRIVGELYGGYSETAGKDVTTGNTLKVVSKAETKTIKGVNNFSKYVFDINAAQNNDTVLTVTDKATSIAGGKNVITIEDNQNIDLRYEGNVCLINNAKGIDVADLEKNNTILDDEIVTTYGRYSIEDGKKLIYTKTSETNKDGSKAPAEGVAAAAAAINTGTDLVMGAGISNLIVSTSGSNNTTETFATSSYGRSKLETGSHADIRGYGVVAGVGRKVFSKNGNKTTGGLFFEYGNSNYDTYNNGYNGDGKSIYKGAGYLMRWDNKSGNYYEGMIHVGKVTNNWNNGEGYSYEMSPTYYGGAVTYGHKFMFSEEKQLSIYGSYIYNHTGSGDAVIGNYKYDFEAVKSQRTRVGVRYTVSDLMDTKKVRPYIGLAWEHEFDGKSEAKYSAIRGSFKDRIDAPSMKGDTGILEIGLKQDVGNWTFGIGAETFIGKRKGWNGTLQALYNF